MGELTSAAYNDLKHMLSDTEFMSKLFMGESKDVAKNAVLNRDGSITIGRQRWKFLNWLFADEQTLSVNDVCLRLISTISGIGNSRNHQAFDALTKDFINNALGNGDYSTAITRIFLGYRINCVGDINKMKEYVSEEVGENKEKVVISACEQISNNSTQAFYVVQDSVGNLAVVSTDKVIHPVKGIRHR